MWLEAANGATLQWPALVCEHFETLRNLPVADDDCDAPIVIVTASQDDVFVWLGALIEWHANNDQAFAQTATWLDERPLAAHQFDRHFVDACLEARSGLLGDLIRTVEFLHAPHLCALLGREMERIVHERHSDENKCRRRLRRALGGDKCVCTN